MQLACLRKYIRSRIHEKTQSLRGDTDEHGSSKHFGGERTLYLPDYIIYCAPKLCPSMRPKNMSDLFSHVVTPFHKNHLSTAAGEHKFAKNGCMKSRLAVLA